MRTKLAGLAGAMLFLGAGKVPPSQPIGTLIATGHITAAGMDGSWHLVTDLRDGRFATRTELTASSSAEVFDGRTHWRVDQSGASHRLDSPFSLRRTRTSAWLARFGWLQPAFGGAGRSAATARVLNGARYDVVVATPAGGEPAELWFDHGSGLLARTVEQDWFRKPVTTYGDYRVAGGLMLPFAIVRSNGANDERITVEHYNTLPSAPAGSYDAPSQPNDHTVPPQGTTVRANPFPQLVVDATLGGRTMSFIFDTGGHSILTPDAARTLGLVSAGGARTGGTGAGTLSEQFTRVSELRIGDAVMRNQAFSVIDLGYATTERGERPPLAGILGLEVVERFIARIDYRRGTLTLLPRDRPVACASGWLAARFSDDMPTVDAVLDGVRAPFTIDTGNNGSIILYEHWLNSIGAARRYNHGLETVSYGAGGASRNWVSYANTFKAGGGTVHHPMVRTTDDKGGVALSVSEAGNLGTDTLGNYTITFDYGRSRVCMDYVPGFSPVPISRAGMRAVKTDPDTILLSFVNEGGPASQAGLRKGDRLAVVDGRSARSLSGGDLSRIFTQPPGTRVRVRYQRGDEAGNGEIVLKDMMPPYRAGRGGDDGSPPDRAQANN